MRPKRRGFECVGGDLEVWAVKFVAVVAWSEGFGSEDGVRR